MVYISSLPFLDFLNNQPGLGVLNDGFCKYILHEGDCLF